MAGNGSRGRNGGNESWTFPIILQPRSEVADLPIDNVALRNIVNTPERVENLFTGYYATSISGQQVQEALFERGEVQL